MPTDPRETLRRRQAESMTAIDQEKEEAERQAPAAELWAAWEELAQCTAEKVGSLGEFDSPRFYEEFAARLIRVAKLLKAQGRLPELENLEGRGTEVDHAINLMFAAAAGKTAKELAALLLETAHDHDFISRVGIQLRHNLRDMILLPRAEPKQELTAQITDQPGPKDLEWLSATAAVVAANEKGYAITLPWITKRKGRILHRPPQLPGKHKLEVEMNSLIRVLFDEAPRNAARHDTDEPDTDARKAIEARKRSVQERKRGSQG